MRSISKKESNAVEAQSNTNPPYTLLCTTIVHVIQTRSQEIVDEGLLSAIVPHPLPMSCQEREIFTFITIT